MERDGSRDVGWLTPQRSDDILFRRACCGSLVSVNRISILLSLLDDAKSLWVPTMAGCGVRGWRFESSLGALAIQVLPVSPGRPTEGHSPTEERSERPRFWSFVTS